MGKIFVRTMKYFSIFIFLSILLSQTGYEIAERINNKSTPDDVKSKLIMTLEDKRGDKMESVIISHIKDDGKKQIMWFFIYTKMIQTITLFLLMLGKMVRMTQWAWHIFI